MYNKFLFLTISLFVKETNKHPKSRILTPNTVCASATAWNSP